MSTVTAQTGVGPLLREWRSRRRRSQMDLALDVGVSTRHISFIETGRSTPSRDVLMVLADGLDIPLRERNALLLAAGYAPRFTESPLDADHLAVARGAVQRILDAHDPYPGVVLDRWWNIVATNQGALRLVADLPDHLLEPPLNVYRLSLHPDGLAARTSNFHEWGPYLLWQLDRLVASSGDAVLTALAEEVHGYPNVAELRLGVPPANTPVLSVSLSTAAGELSMFTTLTTFGTPLDITLDELMIELYYPSDQASADLLAVAAAG